MEASIQDNITLGALPGELDTERLRYAVEQASLSGVVAALPQGLNTLWGAGLQAVWWPAPAYWHCSCLIINPRECIRGWHGGPWST